VAKKATKRSMSQARGQACKGLYQRLDMKGGARDIYKIAKIQEREDEVC
jgi:hypothetical protein